MTVRRLTPSHRALLILLVSLAFAIRAAVPAGWMPMAAADGATWLVPCSGSGPVYAAAMPGMAMPGAVTTSAKPHHDPAAPDAGHECPFAVTALAIDLAAPTAGPAAPILARIAAPAGSHAAPVPGRGLAAPPPPATGPPPLA